ncbi:winged helix-turn-helix domain-containing protein [Kribbella amoyensis]|uniref:winged helix-turn-helix domain-containing protein n=1 Tax=Kribbella amoyensis TaxID=996641 RepID=UPI001EE1BEAB|nr:winged helix-turn-helix domain-containing protein [Kribbella amoyensis]
MTPDGKFPDFLTPFTESGLESAIDELIATPSDVLRHELEPWLQTDTHPFLRGLAAGTATSRRMLGAAVREFHTAVLGPAAAELARRHNADLTLRSRTLMASGARELLAGLHPTIRWAGPTLEVDGTNDYELDLAGRGLALQSSPFTTNCMIHNVPGYRPMLIYPTVQLSADPRRRLATADPLIDLVGRTRATVIRSLTLAATTSELSRRLEISPASASEHCTVLRSAGLISTHRQRGAALHTLTPLALQLISRSDSRRATAESER